MPPSEHRRRHPIVRCCHRNGIPLKRPLAFHFRSAYAIAPDAEPISRNLSFKSVNLALKVTDVVLKFVTLPFPIDFGFFNTFSYPNLFVLFAHLFPPF
jgi:hypothetical protein